VLRLRDARSGDQSWQVTQAIRISRDDPSAGIMLPDRSVSRRHASIVLVNGAFILTDDGSRNGTFVNGRPVTGSTPINQGDHIAFGDVVLVAEVSGGGGGGFGGGGYAPMGQEGADAGRTVAYPGGGDGGGQPPVAIPRSPDPSTDIPRGPFDRETSPARVLRAGEPLPANPAPRPMDVPDANRTVVYGSAAAPVPVTPVSPMAITPVQGDVRSARALADVVADAQALVSSLRRYDDGLQRALRSVDQYGGRATLQACIDRLARVQAGNPTSSDLTVLTSMVSTLRGLLEAELSLLDALSPRVR
jgi:hypothetical protein